MERAGLPAAQKGPRANRSKKTLPAAFCSQASRVKSPAPALDAPGAEGVAAGVAASASGDPAAGGAALPPPPPLPPPLLGWAASNAAAAGAGLAGRSGIRPDSLVFLSSCPQTHGHFAIKKMLHPPTLRLFSLIELPGGDHQRDVLRTTLQDWLGRWCALQAQHPNLLVEVCETFWDAPQGYPMGILCEHMPLGSLDELVQACAGLPEEAMREIAQAVLQALDALHSASPPVVHGCLKPSQVLFNAQGQPKLTFGLEQRLKGCQVWSLPTPQASVPGSRSAEGGSAVAGARGAEHSPAVDIFDLGLLLLVSALGGLDVLLDAIPYARELASRPREQSRLNAVSVDTCALLQHELRGAFQADAAAAAAPPLDLDGATSDMGYLPPASDLLFNRRYSGPFLAFVSTCLEAHTQSSPVTASDLLQHDFLVEATGGGGPAVSLREMQGLARILNEAPEHDPSRFGPAKSARSIVPGVAPSVAQSAQLYLGNIAQSIAAHCGVSAAVAKMGDDSPEWEALQTDTARTLGLAAGVVRGALQTQLERLLRSGAAR